MREFPKISKPIQKLLRLVEDGVDVDKAYNIVLSHYGNKGNLLEYVGLIKESHDEFSKI